MAQTPEKAELRCYTKAPGVQSVMITGIRMMPRLSVECLGITGHGVYHVEAPPTAKVLAPFSLMTSHVLEQKTTWQNALIATSEFTTVTIQKMPLQCALLVFSV